MRTTLELNDDALAEALKAAPGRNKTQVINEALQEFARRRRLAGYADQRGQFHWEGDLDALRQRKASSRQ